MSSRRVGKEGWAKHLLVFVFASGCLALLAGTATAGTITVGWDLMADDKVTGYRVYVGTAPRVYTQTFDVAADRDFFIFRNAFMGRRYYFAVAAQYDGATYGPRSLEVSAVGTRTVGGSLGDRVRVPDPALVADCGVDCFVVTDVARGLGEISSLAVAADGTIFVVEGAQRVVVLRDGASATAFEAPPGSLLRDIALDPRFDVTGRVFVSMLRPLDRATGELEVLRLRYLAGALGEPSTILTGPSLPLAAKAPLAAGDDAVVYVALPVLPARHPYSAAVLAVDQDGRVPAGLASPVAGRGFDEPIDMAWDPSSREVWLLGRSGGSDAQLLPVSSAGAGSAIPAADTGAASVTVSAGTGRRLVVAAGVDLVEAEPGTADSLRISLEAYGAPVAVAAGTGARFAAVRIEGVTPTYAVLKVQDGGAR